MQRTLSRVEKLAFDDGIEASLSSWEHKLEVFGSGPWASLFAGRADASLIGQPVDGFLADLESPIDITFRAPQRFDSVDTKAAFLPLFVEGRVFGADATLRVAVAVNGRIAAFADSYEGGDGAWRFATVIPVESLVQGRNAVELYAVERSGQDLRLLRVGPRLP